MDTSLPIKAPEQRPLRPYFSSGPCPKQRDWTLTSLEHAFINRSHRCKEGQGRILEILSLTRELLSVPDSYKVAMVPASDTGAFEMALWSLLGERGVDVLAFENFGQTWLYDIEQQLKIKDVRKFCAPYGELPDVTQLDFSRDVICVWNGTSSGVCFPDSDFIPQHRKGLVFCDASSAAFSCLFDFTRFDVLTFSWQKLLGSEAAHGMLILSPAAIERLERHRPSWPIPKVFRLMEGGKLRTSLFEGFAINTPSMLCVEDYKQALLWAKNLGGVPALQRKIAENFSILNQFLEESPYFKNLVEDPKIRSKVSVCIKIVDPFFISLSPPTQRHFIRCLLDALEKETIAYDIGSYRTAPLGLRIWCGPTIEKQDLHTLTQWLAFLFQKIKGTWAM